DPDVVSLGASATIDAAGARWRQELLADAGTAGQAARVEPSHRATGTLLRQRIWAPIAGHLGVAPRVFVVPDGALNLVPFSAPPGSRREALTVASLWQQFGRSDDVNDGDSRVLLGADATEGAFKKLGPGRRILHVATHGFFLSDNCAAAVEGTRSVGGLVQVGSTVAASPKPASMLPGGRATLPQNPLLLSGLAMAGANRHALSGPAEED